MNKLIKPKAIIFDVFGTVVDWRTSITLQCQESSEFRKLNIDCALFADKWRGKYRPFMYKVGSGKLPWTNLDDLHRMALDELLDEFKIWNLTELEKQNLNRAWHSLKPWPDSIPGLCRLKRNFITGTLSNGNVSLLVNMAKHAGLPWDCIFSAEMCKAYKPDQKVYQMAISLLDEKPQNILMVAAHHSDLLAAHAAGLATAYIPRPLEYGIQNNHVDNQDVSFVDIMVDDICALADTLDS